MPAPKGQEAAAKDASRRLDAFGESRSLAAALLVSCLCQHLALTDCVCVARRLCARMCGPLWPGCLPLKDPMDGYTYTQMHTPDDRIDGYKEDAQYWEEFGKWEADYWKRR